MGTDQRPRGAVRTLVSAGHVLVGGSALAFAGIMIAAGRSPNAELGGVFLGLGLLLAVAAMIFTAAAVLVLRQAPGAGGGALPLSLSVVEVLAAAALGAALTVAVDGYGAFEPWRSPLLLPLVLLATIGLAGLTLEVVARRPSTVVRR